MQKVNWNMGVLCQSIVFRHGIRKVWLAGEDGLLYVRRVRSRPHEPGNARKKRHQSIGVFYSIEVIPVLTAYLVSSATVLRPSLVMMLLLWDSTVLVLMLSREAIFFVVRPSAIS